MKNKKIYTIMFYDKQANCIENMASYDDLELAKSRAIIWVWQMIEFENLGISFEDLQKKGDMDDPCIARNFTDDDGLYCFDWEDMARVEVIQNTLYFND